MNVWLTISVIVVLLTVVLFIYIRVNSKPISREKANKAVKGILRNALDNGKNISDVQVLIESGEKNFSEKYIYSKKEEVDRPFHVASVGKAFTATLTGMLVDERKLNFDDRITDHLSDDLLTGLFVVDGVDYRETVTIRHLLNHTSGVADYFEDKTIGSEKMTDLILKEKDRFWKPVELVDFTRNFQKARSKPGKKYHYSDTGYILLGLILESVSGKSFAEMLHERIFNPLEMEDSCLMFYSQPASGNSQLNDVWLRGCEISSWKSLSIDWAGGGIVSTLDDLKVFIRALNQKKLISEKTLDEMYSFKNKFTLGIYYGLGFMQYKFSEYFPTLGTLPSLKGHMGVLGTQMFYDKKTDTTVVMNFGSTDFTSKSVRLMISILANVFRISS